jgi:two-component system sensor histidine kinase MprB
MPGSGLGLSIVKDVAEKHGGTVTLEPAPGGGAHFRLRLVAA